MRRRHSLTALVAVAALGLTACGGSSGGGGDEDTIRVAYQRTAQFTQLEDVLEKAKSEYEAANEGRTIELVPIEAEQEQYFTRLALLNRSPSTAPDVIYEDSFQVRSDAAAGYLAPIDDLLEGWDEWGQFDETAKQAGLGDDGQTYGVSMGTDTRGIYFNKQLFEQAGLPTDWQPATWDEVLDAARTVKERLPDVVPLNVYASRAAGEATSMQGFEMLLYGTGDELYDADSQKWITGSQGFRDSLAFYDTVFSEELGPDTALALDAALGSRVATEMLPQGELAIAVDGSWLPGQWISGENEWPEWEETMGIAAMPTQEGQDPGRTSMSGGWLLSVGSQAADPQAAFDFITVALNRENTLKYNTENSQIAVRADVAQDPEYLDYNPSFEFFSSLVPVTNFRPATPDYSQISANIQAATEDVATGAATPEEAAQAYDDGLVAIVGEDGTQAAG
ncbi:extracellular solute-binding protein [Kineococcus terrestris]|uniref:extracellular solute-binding protein n=1 Tax=Kineococcus terrestris TaxID=2044856 RepID=UPI0034DAC8C4